MKIQLYSLFSLLTLTTNVHESIYIYIYTVYTIKKGISKVNCFSLCIWLPFIFKQMFSSISSWEPRTSTFSSTSPKSKKHTNVVTFSKVTKIYITLKSTWLWATDLRNYLFFTFVFIKTYILNFLRNTFTSWYLLQIIFEGKASTGRVKLYCP